VGAEAPDRERLRELQALARKIGQELHQVALELRPSSLDDLGLRRALASYAEEWSERTAIEVDLHCSGLGSDRLPPAVETILYRVTQEALTNVQRHAEARRVGLILERHDQRVILVVEDDGKGFDAETVMGSPLAQGRLGLRGMQERLAQVGGSVTIESAPGAGTTLLIRIPLS
jgi:signal transduction histidine kinase